MRDDGAVIMREVSYLGGRGGLDFRDTKSRAALDLRLGKYQERLAKSCSGIRYFSARHLRNVPRVRYYAKALIARGK